MDCCCGLILGVRVFDLGFFDALFILVIFIGFIDVGREETQEV